jgi:hypothetical protein
VDTTRTRGGTNVSPARGVNSSVNGVNSWVNEIFSRENKVNSWVNEMFSQENKVNSSVNEIFSQENKMNSRVDGVDSSVNEMGFWGVIFAGRIPGRSTPGEKMEMSIISERERVRENAENSYTG